jgi:hypothetical protein
MIEELKVEFGLWGEREFTLKADKRDIEPAYGRLLKKKGEALNGRLL